MKYLTASLFAFTLATAGNAQAAFTIATDAFLPSTALNRDAASCIAPNTGIKPHRMRDYIAPGKNKSPAVSWKGAPEHTRSFALLFSSDDSVDEKIDVNKEGTVIKESDKRMTFYFWVLANIPTTSNGLPAGIADESSQMDYLPEAQAAYALRGLNSLRDADPKRITHKSVMMGYGGPCPPVNDVLVHKYSIKVYALDVEKLELPKDFSGAELLKAMEGHILASDGKEGYYSMNPSFHPKDYPAPVATKQR